MTQTQEKGNQWHLLKMKQTLKSIGIRVLKATIQALPKNEKEMSA